MRVWQFGDTRARVDRQQRRPVDDERQRFAARTTPAARDESTAPAISRPRDRLARVPSPDADTLRRGIFLKLI
jgi:hypothetical protein